MKDLLFNNMIDKTHLQCNWDQDFSIISVKKVLVKFILINIIQHLHKNNIRQEIRNLYIGWIRMENE